MYITGSIDPCCVLRLACYELCDVVDVCYNLFYLNNSGANKRKTILTVDQDPVCHRHLRPRSSISPSLVHCCFGVNAVACLRPCIFTHITRPCVGVTQSAQHVKATLIDDFAVRAIIARVCWKDYKMAGRTDWD